MHNQEATRHSFLRSGQNVGVGIGAPRLELMQNGGNSPLGIASPKEQIFQLWYIHTSAEHTSLPTAGMQAHRGAFRDANVTWHQPLGLHHFDQAGHPLY